MGQFIKKERTKNLAKESKPKRSKSQSHHDSTEANVTKRTPGVKLGRERICRKNSWCISWYPLYLLDFPGGSDGKVSAYNAGDLGLIPDLGRSPRQGNVYPLQCSCLENSMDGGAWWATVHGVSNSRTLLSDFTLLHFVGIKRNVTCLLESLKKNNDEQVED